MIDIYCTDIIKISSAAMDEFSGITYTDSADIKARVKFKDILITDKNGKQVQSTCQVSFDKSVIVKLEDKIKIVSYKNISYENPDQSWAIKDIQKPGGFSDYYIKVIL
jgi:hypothetical protein